MILDLVFILGRAALCVLAVIALTRLYGLRSFSKMSSFDFAITVAIGSVIAGTVISPDENILLGLAALAALFALQALIGWARSGLPSARQALDNAPVMVMKDGAVIEENLAASGMTRDDLMGKLREANAFDLRRVRAVIFEATGDVSVLHDTSQPADRISPEVLEGIRH